MALLKRKRTGLGDAMEVVTRFVNACNRHDADGVYACLHPDFDSIQPMYPSRNFRGADQVRRNWQAIFDAEPGFRLTVLRSAAVDDTIWLELHGAGEDAEVAGVFVMGIQGDRIRWARIYSALVEPVPEGVGEPPAPLREVPRHDQPAVAGEGEVVEEALIAPVLDMDRGGRRRRRRRGADSGAEGELTEAGEAEADEEAGTEAEETVAGDEDVAAVISGNADMQTTVVVDEGDDQVAVVAGDDEVAVVVDDVAVVAEGDSEVTVAATEDVVTVVVDGDSDVTVVEGDSDVVDAGPVTDEPEPEVPVAPAEGDGGPPTEAVDMVTITTDVPEEPAPPDREDPPRRGLFGRKRP
jgi:ketosteroid isomerase-like protein